MNRPSVFRKKKRSGFTLIELLIVILIIAILAAMIVPKLIGRADEAKVAKAMSDVSNFNQLIELFRLDVGRYPTTEEGLEALRTPPGDATGWKGPYTTKSIPLDPWGMPYVYEWPGQYGETSFTVLSYGPDREVGGEGDGADIYGSE